MTFAQIAAQIESYKPWFEYGLAGCIIFYLMHFIDKRLGRIEHRLSGLQRTMLIELLSRDSISIQAKAMAREELSKINEGSNPPL